MSTYERCSACGLVKFAVNILAMWKFELSEIMNRNISKCVGLGQVKLG